MDRIFVALSTFVLVWTASPTGAQAQETGLLIPGDAVVTGFSGVVEPEQQDPPLTALQTLDETFIDLESASARVNGLAAPGYIWDARTWFAEAYFDIKARDVGQVFGVAIDDAKFPNVYLAASSAYGLYRVLPDADNDGRPERTTIGVPGADWMEGMWGKADETDTTPSQGGPGSIWKVDGKSGKVTLFANILHNGENNSGVGLGNITYVPQFGQLFVTDLSTGLIHRLDMDGVEIETFDHGVTGRASIEKSPLPFDPSNAPDFDSADFDPEDSETWGFADEDRRIYALAFNKGRLYYSVVGESQIWSVGFDEETGEFLDSAQWELDVPKKPKKLPVTDMLFTRSGAMVLAQRGDVTSTYDYANFADHGKSRLLRYWLEKPEDDPDTPSRWIAEPEEYSVGFNGQERSTNGGVALNYGYDKQGYLDTGSCEASLWTTGENLRDNNELEDTLLLGGALVIDGLQGMPIRPVKQYEKFNNSPPWVSYMFDNDQFNTDLVDEDERPTPYSDINTTGWIGDVEILRTGCDGDAVAGGATGGWPEGPYYVSDLPYTDGGTGDDTLPPPQPLPSAPQCAAMTGQFFCDVKTGTWIYDGILRTDAGLADKVKIVASSPGVSVVGGPLMSYSVPGIRLTLSGGVSGQLISTDVCIFDEAASQKGGPFACCKATIAASVPAEACEKAGE
ncbi:hypothetical protein [Hoeflea sp. IMCC20628]|uniref:hypothetical protein n=1 Tax=Hoeflea sp. IMCC20628 TaxID=1620421 RepID=UPI0012E0C329|nr:hypothetical protein [Hoeflea sp. IMCC20628]